MTLQRFLIGLIAAVLLQGSVFAWQYRDLLYFRQSSAAILSDRPETFESNARVALTRDRLTRQHLDTIATVAERLGKADIAVDALTRRLELDPKEAQIKLRLADALRRAGRFDRAEKLYSDLIPPQHERP